MKTWPCNIQRSIKKSKFHWKIFDTCIFNIFAQNLNCGYALELPRQGSSYKYPQRPQSMFWSKNKKRRYDMTESYCMGH